MNVEQRIDNFARLGYRLIRRIQASERHLSFFAMKGVLPRLIKLVAVSDGDSAYLPLVAKLESEVHYYRTIRNLGHKTITCPQIYDDSDAYYIAEWVEGEQIPSLDVATADDVTPYLARIAEVLCELDRKRMATMYQHRLSMLQNTRPGRKLHEAIAMGLVNETELFMVSDAIYWKSRYVQPCLQHGDFAPGHIFFAPKCVWVVDAEHADSNHPRFFDLAMMLTKLWVWVGKTTARIFMEEFLTQIEMSEEEFWQRFQPVMMWRSIAVLSDAAADKHRRDYTNVAREIFDRSRTANTIQELVF